MRLNFSAKAELSISMQQSHSSKARKFHIVQKLYGTQRFITMCTEALHWSMCWARWSLSV